MPGSTSCLPRWLPWLLRQPSSPSLRTLPGGLLTVGMKLAFYNHDCSLGFFATDSVGDQLAITAGHCATGLHEKVHNTFSEQLAS